MKIIVATDKEESLEESSVLDIAKTAASANEKNAENARRETGINISHWKAEICFFGDVGKS